MALLYNKQRVFITIFFLLYLIFRELSYVTMATLKDTFSADFKIYHKIVVIKILVYQFKSQRAGEMASLEKGFVTTPDN